jgi:CheY-like chemotaxis protein
MKTNYSIIITDDDLDDQEFLSNALKQLQPGCAIRTAVDGLQLMTMLLEKNAHPDSTQMLPDLIILDLNMPIMDGYEVLKKIKDTVTLHQIPVFILTTSTNELDREKALALGAKGFYSKPMASSDLASIVKNIFSNMARPGKHLVR